MLNTQNIEWMDNPSAHGLDIPSSPDATYSLGPIPPATLGSFLSRPVRIVSNTWSLNTSVSEIFNPWALFFDNDLVAEKMRNFAYIRGKLRIKVTISATPFHYGLLLFSYLPMPTTDDSLDPTVADSLTLLSQRQHIFVNPTESSGGEMTLPFYWPKNYLNIPKRDVDEMGFLILKSMVDLKNVNVSGATGASDVTYSIYAWMEDVEMILPTSSEAVITPPVRAFTREADEYGVVSKPASVVANVASKLASVPVIGSYARATEMMPILRRVSLRCSGFPELLI